MIFTKRSRQFYITWTYNLVSDVLFIVNHETNIDNTNIVPRLKKASRKKKKAKSHTVTAIVLFEWTSTIWRWNKHTNRIFICSKIRQYFTILFQYSSLYMIIIIHKISSLWHQRILRNERNPDWHLHCLVIR